MTKISILGCGWLGLPLAKALLNESFTVKGSTTSGEKLPILKANGIEPFLISLDSKRISGAIDEFLYGSAILVIDIPPQLRSKSNTISTEKIFVEKIKTLLPHINKSTIQHVLFISSTSVYGEVNTAVTEETVPEPTTESGHQLLEAEMLLQNNNNFNTTIIRFGGLIGEDRNPIHFLAGKQNLENPETPINFIHQDDCIGIILKVIISNSWSEIYNGVSPFHPTRESYYTQKAIELNLPIPQFDRSKTSSGKLISSQKTENILGYSFMKTNL